MAKIRFGIIGTGWWAENFQIPAWLETGEAALIAVCDRNAARARTVAARFEIPTMYADAEDLFQQGLDFVDIISSPESHESMVAMAARYRVPVICQKPMSTSFESCQRMVELCRNAGIPFLIHENFRWEPIIRALKRVLDEGKIGEPFRARIQGIGYDPEEYNNQPFLKIIPQFTLTDLGPHIFDIARFLFGEPKSLYCQHLRTRDDIAGEDVSTTVLRIGNVVCTCDTSHATRMEWGDLTGILALVEGTKGTIELAAGGWLRVTTDEGTRAVRIQKEKPYSHVTACVRHLLHSLQTGEPAETNAVDNLATMRMVFSAYQSAATNQVVFFENDKNLSGSLA